MEVPADVRSAKDRSKEAQIVQTHSTQAGNPDKRKASANNQESQEKRSTLTLYYFPICKFGLQQKPLKNSQSYVNSQIIFVDGKRGLNVFSENTHPGFQEEAEVSGFYSGCLLSGAQADASPQFQLKSAEDLRNNPRSRARCTWIHKVDALVQEYHIPGDMESGNSNRFKWSIFALA